MAGTGVASYGGNGVQATTAMLKTPYAVALDTTGNIYIADTGNSRFEKLQRARVGSLLSRAQLPDWTLLSGHYTCFRTVYMHKPMDVLKSRSSLVDGWNTSNFKEKNQVEMI